jgi:hypothetical protein
MIDRNLRIAIGISLGVHIFAMSAVVIVTPGNMDRKKGYTRVDFLGPILEKTAFDIMLESANPTVETSYSLGNLPFGFRDLKVPSPGRMSFEQEFPRHLEDSRDNAILDALIGYKTVPDFYLDVKDTMPDSQSWSPDRRKVVYMPDTPFIMKSLYGGKDFIDIRVRALVDPDGNVKKTEPVTTTGYPKLDITAAEFVKSWIFEKKKAGGEEWITIEVMLDTKD